LESRQVVGSIFSAELSVPESQVFVVADSMVHRVVVEVEVLDSSMVLLDREVVEVSVVATVVLHLVSSVVFLVVLLLLAFSVVRMEILQGSVALD
jgi:hypothetical protein